ncbi:MAG: ribonuclease R [Ignavibacteriaceae bacterium]|nr:ribonuclease R [Ignavibacteriaceae bacterium]
MLKEIKKYFNANPSLAVKSNKLAEVLGISTDEAYSSLKQILHTLNEEGFLIRQGKKFKLNSGSDNRMIGTLEVNTAGYGFVVPRSGKQEDIFIAQRNLGTAFHGDLVEVLLLARQKKKKAKTEGQITKVLKRKHSRLSGVLKKSHSLYYISPEIPEIARDIYIPAEELKGAKEGQHVIIGNIFWENPKLNPVGEVLEVLTAEEKLHTESVAIAQEYGLPLAFNKDTIKESEKIDPYVSDKEIENRIDCRQITTFTIDPDDAKDFDDALSIEFLPDGNYRIGIHIADVSHYVPTGGALDNEALMRGNSTYLVGSVVPMLPENLSNGICSLVPDQDRLTFSVIVEMSPRGRHFSHEIGRSIIHSNRRFTYGEAQNIIESGEGEYAAELTALNALAKILRAKRMKKGSINFFSTEVKFELDSNGRPLKILKREMKDSNMLVEEYMLLANVLVAEKISSAQTGRKAVPFLYRVHDRPDPEKLGDFINFVKSLGYQVKGNVINDPKELNKIIESSKGKPEESLINEIAIRSMAKAIYSADNIGHYGLCFKHYTHFTSPIRRYSDLLVHRILDNHLRGESKALYSKGRLDEICEHISGTERTSVDAERLSVKLKQIEYLKERLGEEFEAVISGVTHFGFFVKLIDILAEGLVHMRELDDDYYVFDEKNYCLKGRRSKKKYTLGDKLRVKLIRIDSERSELDFIVVEE